MGVGGEALRIEVHSTLATLLDAPNEHRSASGANLLWQLAVVELWLQEHLRTTTRRRDDALQMAG